MTYAIVFIAWVVMMTAGLWHKRWAWSRKFFHDRLEWHDGDGAPTGFDGASMTSRCANCGKRVLQDSQGGWFTVHNQDD